MSAWAQTLLLWSWQSLLLVGFVLVIVRIARSQSAASRHSFWLLAVLVISVLPVVNAIVRALPVAAPAVAPITYIAELPAVAVDALPITAQPASSARDFITPFLLAIWSLGVLISVGRSFLTSRRWRRIVRSASGVEKTSFAVPIGYSTEVEAPVLVGTLRPMIVLPSNIEAWTTAEERRAVLLHELAHFERRDHWISPVQAVLGAVFFFHPAVRYALRQLVLERELACDERVLAIGTSPATYAEIILRVAEHSIPGRQSDCPAFNSPGKILERRIEMILSYPSMVSRQWRVPAIGRVAIVLVLASLLLPQRAIVAETPGPPPPEIQMAALQPLTEAAAMIASAIPTETVAQPVSLAAEPPQSTQAAQAEFGTVSGTVVDPSGAVVPGVSVSLASVAGQVLDGRFLPYEANLVRTDNTGAFAFPRVAAGEWTFTTSIPGFTSIAHPIQVRSGEALVHKVALTVATVSTMVNVTASRPGAPQNANAISRPAPLRVGGEIIQPRLITQVKPAYPAAARDSGVQDFVQLQAIIGKDGTIVSVQVDPKRLSPGNPDLDRAAMDAVQQWRYTPAILNGAPIEIATTIRVNFTLE